jgi:hypothetical protein
MRPTATSTFATAVMSEAGTSCGVQFTGCSPHHAPTVQLTATPMQSLNKVVLVATSMPDTGKRVTSYKWIFGNGVHMGTTCHNGQDFASYDYCSTSDPMSPNQSTVDYLPGMGFPPLVSGQNTFTVTAFDECNLSSSASASFTW